VGLPTQDRTRKVKVYTIDRDGVLLWEGRRESSMRYHCTLT
jgi:hypothetical protein